MRLQNLELAQQLGKLPLGSLGMGTGGGAPLSEIIQR